MFQLLNSLRLWASNDGTGRNLTKAQLKREAQILKERLNKLDAVSSPILSVIPLSYSPVVLPFFF
jgi:hypothetical protein